jgi:hypothetical protein
LFRIEPGVVVAFEDERAIMDPDDAVSTTECSMARW